MFNTRPPFYLTIILTVAISVALSAQEVPVSNYETVRNGTFLYGNSAWFTAGTYTGLYPDAAADSQGAGLSLRTGSGQDTTTYAMQQLYFPTSISAARLSLTMRFEAGQGARFSGLQIAIASSRNNQIQPVIVLDQRNNNNFGGFNWQHVDLSLNQQQLQQINSLRGAGQPLYLYIQLNATWVNVHLDTISLTVNGTMRYPRMVGQIAFSERFTSEGAIRFRINTISPNGSNLQQRYQNQGEIYGLEWTPGSAGLIFSSSQELATSPFSGDIFHLQNGIITKLTTATEHHALRDKGGPVGTVKGTVINWTKRTVLAAIMVEGAPQATFITLAPHPQPGHEQSYTINGVIDAGNRLQLVHGREGSYVWLSPGGVDVKPGGTATAADLIINETRASYTATSLSYSNDGSRIYFAFPHIAQIPASGGLPQNPPGWENLIPTSGVAHSPASDQIAYVSGTSNDIYLSKIGGSPRIAVPQGSASWASSPRWTADGSGFVFIQSGGHNPTGSNDIHYYHLANGQVTPLTMFFNEGVEYADPSPDGRFIVFQRTMRDGNSVAGASKTELWIMPSDNPAVMWPLVTQGNPAFPRWK